MDGSLSPGPAGRKSLMNLYRKHPEPAVRQRAHIVLLLCDGWSWSEIESALYCSRRTIDRWKKRFEEGGADALEGRRRGRRPIFEGTLLAMIVTWVTTTLPRDFGFLRSRWTCECLCLMAFEFASVRISRETIRRCLHRERLVWRRPRPVLRIEDPRREAIWRKLRHLLGHLPASEVAVFQDEADVNTNPKIGSMWMVRGEQAEVETPGNNVKRYLAGSLNWRTGDLILTGGQQGEGRNSKLFIRHLDELRTRLRRYTRIHVICDNASFHDSRAVRQYLAEHRDRIVIHFLPKYAPDLNPIERIWWHLHEEITRNHRCKTIEELLDQVFEWLEHRRPFEVERDAYLRSKAA
ncbi:MAG: IS630 family transposase [Verrucomicrobia bacterium]|nr:IS630 family transposase [Verrucomicrobiota bacterium]